MRQTGGLNKPPFSRRPALQLGNAYQARLRSRPLHGTVKRMRACWLYRSRCHSADFKTRETQIGRTRIFDTLNSLEKHWNRALCSEYEGILQQGEAKTLWQEKCVGNHLWWHAYEFSEAWDSLLECCIASTIIITWKTGKQIYPEYLDGSSDIKASLLGNVMFIVDEIGL